MKEGTKEIYMLVLGSIVVLGFLALLYILMFVKIPEANSDLLFLAAGIEFGLATTVVNYFFGSSKSSSEKTKMLAEK